MPSGCSSNEVTVTGRRAALQDAVSIAMGTPQASQAPTPPTSLMVRMTRQSVARSNAADHILEAEPIANVIGEGA